MAFIVSAKKEIHREKMNLLAETKYIGFGPEGSECLAETAFGRALASCKAAAP